MHTPPLIDVAIVGLLVFIAIVVVCELIERNRTPPFDPDDDEPERETWIEPDDQVSDCVARYDGQGRIIAQTPVPIRRATPKPVTEPFD